MPISYFPPFGLVCTREEFLKAMHKTTMYKFNARTPFDPAGLVGGFTISLCSNKAVETIADPSYNVVPLSEEDSIAIQTIMAKYKAL